MIIDVVEVRTSSRSTAALVGIVTPRPIAWVTTVDGRARTVNLGPVQLLQRVRRQSTCRRLLAGAQQALTEA